MPPKRICQHCHEPYRGKKCSCRENRIPQTIPEEDVMPPEEHASGWERSYSQLYWGVKQLIGDRIRAEKIPAPRDVTHDCWRLIVSVGDNEILLAETPEEVNAALAQLNEVLEEWGSEPFDYALTHSRTFDAARFYLDRQYREKKWALFKGAPRSNHRKTKLVVKLVMMAGSALLALFL